MEKARGMENNGKNGKLKGTVKEIQRRIEKEVGNCNGKYDRMVNHHFAQLISRPRGNRACFIQQFIRSPSILALNTLSPRRSTVHRVYRSAQQRHGLSEDLPAIISDRRQNSQTSLQTVYRLNQHHSRFPFTKSSIAAVSTSLPNITHRKMGGSRLGGSLREGLGQQH